MRQMMMAALLALTMIGCTATSQYGNFVPTAADQERLAEDAVQQLVALYPPAKTRFELQQITPDIFGLTLVNSLRERGYALMEFDPEAETQPLASGALSLRYVLDRVDPQNLYHLTLLVGDQSLTRPYLEENGTFSPAGHWARKE